MLIYIKLKNDIYNIIYHIIYHLHIMDLLPIDFDSVSNIYKNLLITGYYESLIIFGDDLSLIILSYIIVLPKEYEYSILKNNEIYEQMKQHYHNLLFLHICIDIEYLILTTLELSIVNCGNILLNLINEKHYNKLLQLCNIQLINKTSYELEEWYYFNIDSQISLKYDSIDIYYMSYYKTCNKTCNCPVCRQKYIFRSKK